MKEATGELNMTVITIVAIAAIVAFFYFFIYPGIRDSIALNQACNDPSTYADQGQQANDAGDEVTCDDNGTDANGNREWTCTLGTRTKTCPSRAGQQ